MKLPLINLVFTLLIFSLSLAFLQAAGSRAWVTSSRQDFEAGTLDGVVVSSRGDIRLGLQRSLLLSPARNDLVSSSGPVGRTLPGCW